MSPSLEFLFLPDALSASEEDGKQFSSSREGLGPTKAPVMGVGAQMTEKRHLHASVKGVHAAPSSCPRDRWAIRGHVASWGRIRLAWSRARGLGLGVTVPSPIQDTASGKHGTPHSETGMDMF